MNREQLEYFNSNREIPFTTHKDIMKLEKKYIEALAFITYMASETDFETISEIGGFEGQSEIEDNSLYSYKFKRRSEIYINDCGKYFGKSRNTITNYLNYLEYISDYSNYLYINGEGEELLQIDHDNNDTIYRLNHKCYEGKYYTTIDTDTLRKLIQLNGTAIKLYLIIKINYENCKRKNKPCILDMKFLANEIGLNATSQISKTLDKMDNIVIKRRLKYKSDTVNLNKKNAPKKIYEYKII